MIMLSDKEYMILYRFAGVAAAACSVLVAGAASFYVKKAQIDNTKPLHQRGFYTVREKGAMGGAGLFGTAYVSSIFISAGVGALVSRGERWEKSCEIARKKAEDVPRKHWRCDMYQRIWASTQYIPRQYAVAFGGTIAVIGAFHWCGIVMGSEPSYTADDPGIVHRQAGPGR